MVALPGYPVDSRVNGFVHVHFNRALGLALKPLYVRILRAVEQLDPVVVDRNRRVLPGIHVATVAGGQIINLDVDIRGTVLGQGHCGAMGISRSYGNGLRGVVRKGSRGRLDVL